MSEKKLQELLSIISEGQDSEQRRKVEQYITDLQKEIERLNNIIKEVRENINKKLNVNSDYVDYDFGTELLRQELLEILDKGE